ncbi:cobalt transporter CbiM [Desulfovibrio inopinatus]|uniref:cobalt transporter CbiM n=1 Tax=Desulfovibrio inopinatus TaxID=102109 RepID=UPI00042385E9|nr:cobalt transporter CbiM [Desulfovibrio inopinatus]
MHISEGVLSPPLLGAGWALTAVGTAIGLKSLDYDRIMTVAVLAAVFFVASLVHVPIGPSSVHLLLSGLLGLILGFAAFPAILAGLFLQAVFFQFGGLTVLGASCFNMAFPAVLLGLTLRPFLYGSRTARSIAAFSAGAGAIILSALSTAACLGLTSSDFLAAAQILVLGHLPVAVIEGFITMATVSFILKVQPDMLVHTSCPSASV